MIFSFKWRVLRFCNYADDTTTYLCDHELETIASKIKSDAEQLSKWLHDNDMKLTAEQCLDLKNHTNIRCKKVGQQLHTLARIPNYMDTEKLRIIMNAFIFSQFSYFQLVLIFHDRPANRKINEIHERVPRVAYRDNCSNYGELLVTGNTISIHYKHLQLFAFEIYKIKGISFHV